MSCERITFRRRIARRIYRGIFVKNDYANARLGRETGKGKRVYRQKIIAFVQRAKIEKRREGDGERMKDDEGIVLYLLWHDHRPLRIVNVADYECHRLWDIGDWEGPRFSKEIPQVNGKERGQEGTRTTRPLGVGASGKLINAQGNYVGLAEITPREIIVIPS